VLHAVLADQLGHEPGPERVQEREPDLARLVAQRLAAGVELLQRAAHVRRVRLTVPVGDQRAPDAIEELDAELRLEAAQGAREGGLGDVQRGGGAGDVGVIDDGDEPAELIDLHGDPMFAEHRFGADDALECGRGRA
jgi:hypothetical protein